MDVFPVTFRGTFHGSDCRSFERHLHCKNRTPTAHRHDGHLKRDHAHAVRVDARKPHGIRSPSFIKSVTSKLFGLQFLPSIILYGLIIIPLVFYLLNHSRFGKQVYLLGNNPVAARLNGVNINRVQILTYVFSGMFAAFAGMLGAAYMNARVARS